MITSFFSPKESKGTSKPKRSREKEESSGSAKKAKNDDEDSASSRLLSSLTEPSWRSVLERHTKSTTFSKLAQFVQSERQSSKPIFPPAGDVFSALHLTPLDQVKVVVVGQDPYHGPNQGHGLAFSVRKGVAIPPSLRNIYKELVDDPDIPTFQTKPTHGFLGRWAKQGVLMLNAVLTVRQAEANSHKNKGWEQFTDEVIRQLLKHNKQHLVFLLWGKPAAKKASDILGGAASSKRLTVIQTSHPSPLGAAKTKSPFLGSQCFSKCNAALRKHGLDPIDWNVDSEHEETE